MDRKGCVRPGSKHARRDACDQFSGCRRIRFAGLSCQERLHCLDGACCKAWRQNVAPRDWERMADHCRRMLSLTASSFVLVYDVLGVIFVPALSVVSATAPCNPHEFYSRTAMRFYEDHFECFLGDLNLSSTDAATLERLGVGHALFLGASQIQPVDLQMQLKAMS